MSDYDWHGWSVNGRSVSVGKLPERKSIALYMSKGCTSWPLAYFTNEVSAREFLGWLDEAMKRAGGTDARP